MKQYSLSFFILLFLLAGCGKSVSPVTPSAVPGTVALSTAASSTTAPSDTPAVTRTPSTLPTINLTVSTMVMPTYVPEPSATPIIVVGERSPACSFPLAGTTTEESIPENYMFSEPRVVLAGPYSSFEIVEWLPDNEQALIVQKVIKDHYEQYQSIQLFNPRTIKAQVYARRARTSDEPPLWVEELQAVLYPERQIVSWQSDQRGMPIPASLVESQSLWLSRGDPGHLQKLKDRRFTRAVVPHEWIISTLVAKPDGSRIVYLENNGTQLSKLYSREVIQGSLEIEQQLSFNGPTWGDPGEPGPWNGLTRMTWHPDTSQVFFYNYVSPTDHTFLLDIDTGQVCEFSFGGWIYFARWSPNGRYLAMIKAQGAMQPLAVDYDLIVFDTATGKLYQIDAAKLSPPDMMDVGVHIVGDIAWAPDNRHILAAGWAGFSGTSPPPSATRLYLVDFLSGQVDSVFPQFDLQSPHRGTGLAWSPDGSKVLALCPGICLISVQKTGP